MTAARVIRVPRVEEAARWGPPAFCGPLPPAVPAKPCLGVAAESEPLVFALEGFDDADVAREQVSESARLARSTIERLLSPGRDDTPVHSAAQLAVQVSGGDLQGTAAALQRMGWTTKMRSSPGGSLRQLRHTYLTATRHTHLHGEPAEWVVDPTFAQAFQVADPTPRYAYILSAVPSMAVAPLGRLLRAVLLLGGELERCFEQRGLPLPPWRSADALATRYDQAAPAPAPSSGAAAAAARKHARAVQQLQGVQLRLLKLGVAPLTTQQSAAEAEAEAGSPPSPASSSSGSIVGAESPTSVVEASQGALARAFRLDAETHECVCCGWREEQQGSSGSSSSRQQQRQWPRRLAASAA